MYILFFNGVSTDGYIWLYTSTNRDLVASELLCISWKESAQTSNIISSFLGSNDISWEKIQNIVVVTWPGSFTWVRAISLVVNTLAYVYPHLYLTQLSFFDLYKIYPIVKSSSKRDVFIKYSENDIVRIEKNGDFDTKVRSVKKIYGDVGDNRFDDKLEIDSYIDYNDVVLGVVLQDKKKLAPLYIKKPNIS